MGSPPHSSSHTSQSWSTNSIQSSLKSWTGVIVCYCSFYSLYSLYCFRVRWWRRGTKQGEILVDVICIEVLTFYQVFSQNKAVGSQGRYKYSRAPVVARQLQPPFSKWRKASYPARLRIAVGAASGSSPAAYNRIRHTQDMQQCPFCRNIRLGRGLG